MLDDIIIAIDRGLKTLSYEASGEKKDVFAQSIPLMRANYSGEVAAQGLYLGAWLMETDGSLREFYEHAMDEEFRHLRWCGDRVQDLGGEVSRSTPLWFFGACVLGAASRVCGKQYALGFIVETEKQVLEHLASHRQRLPKEDHKSHAIIEKMIAEEQAHGDDAFSKGASVLPSLVKTAMHYAGRVLTTTSEWV